MKMLVKMTIPPHVLIRKKNDIIRLSLDKIKLRTVQVTTNFLYCDRRNKICFKLDSNIRWGYDPFIPFGLRHWSTVQTRIRDSHERQVRNLFEILNQNVITVGYHSWNGIINVAPHRVDMFAKSAKSEKFRILIRVKTTRAERYCMILHDMHV